MKELIFLNPPKRRKTKRTMRTKRRTTRRKPVRRNATARKRVTPRRRIRRNPLRRRHAPIRNAVKRRVKRRVYKRVKRLGRRHQMPARRRYARRNPVHPRLGKVLSREMILLGAGVVGSGFISNLILGSPKVSGLPGINSTIGQALYRLALSVGAGALVNKFGGSNLRSLAKGIIIGGIANAISEGVDYARGQTSVAGTGEYFPALTAPSNALGAAGGGTPGYQASQVFGGIYDGESAFESDSW